MNDLSRFLQQQLDELLLRFPHVTRLVVAYSGGLDSSVLLHLCASLREPGDSLPDDCGGRSLEAVHVDHGLSPRSADWVVHCREQCRNLGVPLSCHAVDVPGSGGSEHGSTVKVPEALARDARYAIFSRCLDEHSALLMAHHQDDQAETVLLRLLRGAGPDGLAGMPERRSLGRGELWRPLLRRPRAELEEYAEKHALSWVEDASNSDERVDRNYLRHRVLPLIGERWPAWRGNWQLSAGHCAEAAVLASGLADMDLATLQPAPLPFTPARQCLDCGMLRGLPVERQRNVLRHWLQRETGAVITSQHLSRVLEEVITARAGARPEVVLGACRLRRHRHTLVVSPDPPPVDENWQCTWQPTCDGDELVLPGNGFLVARSGVRGGVADGTIPTLRFRRPGDRCRSGNRPSRSLSRMLWEEGVPEWWRRRLPLVTVNGEVVWIPGVGGCGPATSGNHAGWAFDWYPPGRVREPDHSGG